MKLRSLILLTIDTKTHACPATLHAHPLLAPVLLEFYQGPGYDSRERNCLSPRFCRGDMPLQISRTCLCSSRRERRRQFANVAERVRLLSSNFLSRKVKVHKVRALTSREVHC